MSAILHSAPELGQRKLKGHSLQLAELILQSLEDLRFGSVEVIVHESRVVQIERKEKFRFPNQDPK